MSFYQPAHAPSLSKHNAQVFEFDSPATIAKQQHNGFQQQPFVQAGGPSTGLSAPAPPALPQLSYKQPSRQWNLKTRDWNNQPWKTNNSWENQDSYKPPASLLNTLNSSSRIPVYNNNPSTEWGNRSISSTASSPRTPSLLGVYDSKILAGQTLHLQHSSSSPSIAQPTHMYDKQSHHPSNLPPFAQAGALPASSGLSSSGHSGLPTSNYKPSSTIPLSHNFHLPSSGLARSTSSNDISLSKNNWDGSNNWNTNSYDSYSSSSIPSAPAWTGFKYGAWRANQNKSRSMRPLRVNKNWGTRNENGWSGFNNQNILNESFLRNRPTPIGAAPIQAPRLPSFLNHQRKWRSGPYKNRLNLRTKNWGTRNENGWSSFNQGLYANESALPFMANRQRWIDQERSAYLQESSAPIQQSQSYAPIQQTQSFAPIQTQAYGQSSFTPLSAAPLSALPLATAAPMRGIPLAGAPLAAAPLAAPLKGRKARKAGRQLAIQQKLTTELNPPTGDPAVNHYRRGAKVTVPLAGPAIAGEAAPTGSIGSRRTGRRNNLGRRRGRLAGPALPVPATQPPLASGLVTPVVSAAQGPIPLNANSNVFTPLTGTHAPSFARAGSAQNLAAPIVTSQGQYTAQGQFLEKQFIQQPTMLARPTGSATF